MKKNLKNNFKDKTVFILNLKYQIKVFIFLSFSSFSAFLFPLIQFKERCIVRDWGLFNSFSLFNHSCWNFYKKLPMHNPYVLGGMDNLANPQTKVFSPLQIFDVFFHPAYANLFSLITLSIFGGYGFYLLLKYLKVSNLINLFCSFLYIHASWFHLHFVEGHIIFGSFMMFGFIVLSIIRIEENKFKLLLAITSALMILDGGMYAFIYSLLLFILILLFKLEGISFRKVFLNIKKNVVFSSLSVLVFIGLSAFKIIPLLLLHANRTPILENFTLDATSLLHAFFNPMGHVELVIKGSNFRDFVKFHEIGAYIGVLSFLIILVYTIKNRSRKIWPYFILIIFFLWMGSGFGDPINPWRIFQKIPILNNAHVQSRALFMVYLFMLILLAFSLDWFKVKWRKLTFIILVLLGIEGIYLSFYPYYKIYQSEGSTMLIDDFPKIIENNNVDVTYRSSNVTDWGHDFYHFKRFNAATKYYMDPSNLTTHVKSIEEDDYKGEIYLLKGIGIAKTLRYTPGEIDIDIQAESNCKIQLNTNFLLGWKSNNSAIDLMSEKGLITLNVPKGKFNVKLKYEPTYLIYSSILTIVSLLLIIFLCYKLKKENHLITRPNTFPSTE